MYQFEFDPRKSATNKTKHGIEFVEGQAIWDDIDRLEIPARTADESRSLVIGKIADRYWSAFITHHGSNIWIISVRPSRQYERELYEGQGF